MAEEEKVEGPGINTDEKPLFQKEMSQEEYDRKMRDVYLGISTVMPDGTPLSEVHKNIRDLEKEQDAARAARVTKTYETTVAQAQDTGKIKVTSTITGVLSEDPIIKAPKPETPAISDIPDDFPHRADVIKAGHINWEAVVLMDEAGFLALPGVGTAKAKEMFKYVSKVKG